MKKSIFLSGVVALSLGIAQSASMAVAHGHGGGHGGGHHGGGHHGGGHHGGGHHHHGGGGHHGGGHHGGNVNVDIDDDDDNGNFWGGAALGAVVGYGLANSNDPCQDRQYRIDYPGNCPNY